MRNKINKKAEHAPHVRLLLEIFSAMSYIGLFTFGGGYAMIPQMSRIFVEKKGWIPREDIADLLALAQSLPGVLAVNTATLVGYRVAGVWGAGAAALGAVLPSFAILSGVTLLYHVYIDSPVVLAAFRGLSAAVAGLLPAAVCKLWTSSVRGLPGWTLFLIALAVTLFIPSVNLIFLILGGGLCGLLLTVLKKNRNS